MAHPWRPFLLVLAGVVVTSCAGGPAASSPGTSNAASLALEPTPEASLSSGEASPAATIAPSASPEAALLVEGFATVVADRVVVRREPGRSSEFVTIQCFDVPMPCPVLELGVETPWTSVYLLEGPVAADGYDWYLAAIDDGNSLYPEYVGWIAAGEEADAWLAPQPVSCPAEPVELADVTYAAISRLLALHCFGDRELSLRGWYTDPPPGEPLEGGDCASEPAWLVCSFGGHMLRTAVGSWVGDANHLPLRLHPDLGAMPPRPGWVVVTGQFDHPSAAECGNGEPASDLFCRVEFVVTAARSDEE